MRKIILLLFFTVIGISCCSERKLLKSYDRSGGNPIDKQTIGIDGMYPDTCCGNKTRLSRTLLQGLSFDTGFLDSIRISDVVLKYDKEEKLNVKLMQGSMLYKDFDLIIKKRNGYLSVKRNLSLLPLPFFYIHHERKLLVFKNDKNELVTILGVDEFAFILLMAGGHDYIDVSKFKTLP